MNRMACLFFLLAARTDAYDFRIPAGPVAILSDTQDTEPLQKLIGDEDNDAIRPQIVEALAQEKPAAVIIAGDLVNVGALESWRSWSVFDREFKPLFKAKIPVFPALGNHEYFGPDEWALKKYFQRFPQLENRRFYSVQAPRVLFIILDSNFASLKKSGLFDKQLEWLGDTLQKAEKDSHVSLVTAIFHHPPYTNAKARYHETPAARDFFFPLFRKSSKLKVVISGHAQNYERFYKNGIHFFVTGTGGGPRDPLLTGEKSIHEDLSGDTRAIRDFGYVRLTPSQNQVRIELIRLHEGRWGIGDALTVKNNEGLASKSNPSRSFH